tara:strand:- start:7009 stop:9864 length:2856 start_codon:yes stop_codon:yes gene_type:complete
MPILKELRDRVEDAIKRELTSDEAKDIATMADALISSDQVFAGALSETLLTDTMKEFAKSTDTSGVSKLAGLGEGIEDGLAQVHSIWEGRRVTSPASVEAETLEQVLREAAMRHMAATQFDIDAGRPVTVQDIKQDMRIRKEKSKWASKITAYTNRVTQEMNKDMQSSFLNGLGPQGENIQIAWVKASLWKDDDSQPYRVDEDDPHRHLIEQLRDPKGHIRVINDDGTESSYPVVTVYHETAEKIDTFFESNPNFYGAGTLAAMEMKTTPLTQEHIAQQLRLKALAAGADITQAHIREWIAVTTDSIYFDALSAVGGSDDLGLISEDQTEAWVTLQKRLSGLGELTPEGLTKAGLTLLGERDTKQWFGAFIRQDPAIQEMFPTELDREMLAVDGWNAMRSRWSLSGTDDGFTEWVINNIATEAPDIIQTQKDIHGGVHTEPGRMKRFEDMARAAEWAGQKILPDDPTPFERRTLARTLREAEQEFIDRGSIPGTFEEIVAERLSNWGEAVRKSTATDRQQMGQLPPGFRPDVAMAEGLARLEQRVGGKDLIANIAANEALVGDLQAQYDNLRQLEIGNLKHYIREPDKELSGRVEEAQKRLNRAKEQGDTYKTQLAERTKEAGLNVLLRDDAQLSQAFASGNSSSLRSAADDRDIPPDEINDLVAMQARSGIPDTGAVQVATPEMLAEEQRLQEVRAAQWAARTVSHDAEGNLIPHGRRDAEGNLIPEADSYNVRTQVRTDPEGNVIPPNPDALIPFTQLPDTQENRDAVGQGFAKEGERQGQAVQKDELGRAVLDEAGNPVLLAAPALPEDDEPQELILGARRVVPAPPQIPTDQPPPRIPTDQPDASYTPLPRGPAIGAGDQVPPAREPDIGAVDEFIPADTDIVVPPPPAPPPPPPEPQTPEPQTPEPQTPEPRRGREAWLAGSQPEAPIPEEEEEEKRKKRGSRQLE